MSQNHPIVYIYQKDLDSGLSIPFLDILLNETLVYGTVYVPKECFQKVSTLNHRLPAKQVYDLLLRLACEFPIYLTNQIPENQNDYSIFSFHETAPCMETIQTDCYLISRYKKLLLERQLFDPCVASIIEQASLLSCKDLMVSFLSEMLNETDYYFYYYLGSQPFLIYTGETVCYSILSIFAEKLGNALQSLGYLVLFFDCSKEHFTAASRFIRKSFQAVIGMQTYMFSAKLINNRDFFHDSVIGPKYNFLFDHPIHFQQHLRHTPKNLTLLTLDYGYMDFIKKYYGAKAIFFPPGGILHSFSTHKERIYDITFIGSNFNYSEEMSNQIQALNRQQRFILNHFLLSMRKHPQLPAEASLKQTLYNYGITLNDSEFFELFYNLRRFVLYMAAHYRNKILDTVLNSGIEIHVFGSSWEHSRLRKYPNFIWHNQDLSTEECLEIWQQSKLSLNVMSWHKNAVTERILNSMLQKSVVLTERNPYLEKNFESGKEILYYDLDNLQELPKLILKYLAEPQMLSDIAENAYQKALSHHTWEQRAKQLIALADADSGISRTTDN